MIPFATALGASLWTLPFLVIYLIFTKVISDPYLLIIMRQGIMIGIPCVAGYFGFVASNDLTASISVGLLWMGIIIFVLKKGK